MGVLESRQNMNLTAKVLARLGLAEELLAQHLDHHLAIGVELAGQPDLAHTALVQRDGITSNLPSSTRPSMMKASKPQSGGQLKGGWPDSTLGCNRPSANPRHIFSPA